MTATTSKIPVAAANPLMSFPLKAMTRNDAILLVTSPERAGRKGVDYFEAGTFCCISQVSANFLTNNSPSAITFYAPGSSGSKYSCNLRLSSSVNLPR